MNKELLTMNKEFIKKIITEISVASFKTGFELRGEFPGIEITDDIAFKICEPVIEAVLKIAGIA